MTNNKDDVKAQFLALFAEWKRVIQHPDIRLSSRPMDYADNQPYRDIVKLGMDVLPFLIEKLEEGEFLLNQAVLDVAGVPIEELFRAEKGIPSEQERSVLLVRWWRSRR